MILNLTFSTIADVLAKFAGITRNNNYLYVGLFVSIFTSYFYLMSVKLGGLTIAPSILLIMTLIISVGLGYFYFEESLSRTQMIGVLLGLVAVLLILDVF
jgi:drug/metabolite transporter (DMT)-like permease